MKRSLIIFILASSCAIAAKRPNIVIIMTDDSGYTDLGCYGSEIETPCIDRLAGQGMRLSNFYTNGRCSPTRASLLTGLDSAKVGFGDGVVGDWHREFNYPAHRGRLPYNTPVLPELLKDAGYHTMMVGKWHLGGSIMKLNENLRNGWTSTHPDWALTEQEVEADFLALPSQRGFNEYFGLYGAQDHLFITPEDQNPIMEGNQPAKLDFSRTYTMRCDNGRYGANDGKTGKAFYDTDGITDRALQMIDGAAGADKPPFLMYVSYRAPHLPLQAPQELFEKYLPVYKFRTAEVEAARVQGLRAEGLYPEEAGFRKKWLPIEKLDKMEAQMALHAAMMEKIDENVGRVVDSLKAAGELENTLILFFSDNGCASHLMGFLNAPYHGSKALLWEGGAKSHFIAVWPGKIQPGSISHSQAWVGDILPTCLEIAGTAYPASYRGAQTEPLDGRSILPALKGEQPAPADTLFFSDKGQQGVVYQGRWKLLIDPGWYQQTQKVPGIAHELYDLQNDPAETTNLAASNPEMVQELSRRCAEWKQTVGIVDYAERIKIRPNDPY